MYNFDDTIAALSTAVGESGIGIVRMSGPNALKIADAIFMSKDAKRPSKFKTYTTHYGHIVAKTLNNKSEIIDEVLLTVMRRPKSYTKEDIVEINCHGGIQAQKAVLELVIKRGARMAEPGEFTKRAFLNGRIDLVQAEAVLDIIKAKTDASFKTAKDQLEGVLSKSVNELRDIIIDVTSEIEQLIDFPEEEHNRPNADIAKKIKGAIRRIKDLIDSAASGIVLREGILAVICGRPNSGKSSLMNLLLKRDRVIVTPIPGTTRDAVEETINIKGIPIRLVDTAGIGHTRNALDKEGMKRSKKYLDTADMALVIFDGSKPLNKEDAQLVELTRGKKKIAVINKIDLPKKLAEKRLRDIIKEDNLVSISALKRTNIESLEKAIAQMVFSGQVEKGESAVVTNIRHKELLEKAKANLLEALRSYETAGPEVVAIDLKEAIFNLGLIVGKSISDDVLNRIFEKFCIGK